LDKGIKYKNIFHQPSYQKVPLILCFDKKVGWHKHPSMLV